MQVLTKAPKSFCMIEQSQHMPEWSKKLHTDLEMGSAEETGQHGVRYALDYPIVLPSLHARAQHEVATCRTGDAASAIVA